MISTIIFFAENHFIIRNTQYKLQYNIIIKKRVDLITYTVYFMKDPKKIAIFVYYRIELYKIWRNLLFIIWAGPLYLCWPWQYLWGDGPHYLCRPCWHLWLAGRRAGWRMCWRKGAGNSRKYDRSATCHPGDTKFFFSFVIFLLGKPNPPPLP